MKDVHKMGSKADLENRISQERVDNKLRRANIAKARKLVYEKGASVNSTTVSSILGSESTVPTVVSTAHANAGVLCMLNFLFY
jgi:hypothetical protein